MVRLLSTCLVALLLSQTVASAQPSLANQHRRIERLAGIARIWGLVKFFHPALIQRPIDWDGAMKTAVMSLGPSASKDDYRGIVQTMLSHLDDPRTGVRDDIVPTMLDTAPGDS